MTAPWGLMLATAASSVGAVSAAAVVLRLPESFRQRAVPLAVAFAAGTMLGAVFLGLLPHALEHGDAHRILPWCLAGIIAFFGLERFLLWRHCHAEHCPVHGRSAELILIGDALHNCLDGVVLAVAWSTSPTVGLGATVAIIAHEIPQEIGDFAILLDAGWSPRKAVLWNLVSATATIPGALGGWLLLADLTPALPPMMALAAAGFLYIAVADILPGLHQRRSGVTGWLQFPLILLGVATIVLCHGLSGPEP